jgi:hypothetical protein
MTLRRSNRGVSVDLDALMAQHNTSTAVGNMRVNAAGDVLGPNGEIVQKNEERVRAYYKNNPRSSTSASIKGDVPSPAARIEPDVAPTKTARTVKENVRTAVSEPDEFAAPDEPIGYKEVKLPNGDIEMVPVYNKKEL